MEGKQNPLLNPLILYHVTSFISYREKKELRFVCHIWNEEIKKAIRKSSRVQIDSSGDRRLENLVGSCCDPAFASDFSFGPGVSLGESSKALQCFFSRFGARVKSLSIINSLCTPENLKQILYKGCPNLEILRFVAVISGRLFPTFPSAEHHNEIKAHLPKLKCLHINVRSSDLVRNTEFMVDLLSIAPNLETISWLKLAHDEVNYDRNFQLDLEKAWSAQRAASGLTIRDTIYDVAIHYSPLNLSNLSKIESNMRLSDASLIALRDRRFPLKYLDIRLTIDVNGSSLRSLFESLSTTLQSLKIEFYPCLLNVAALITQNSKITHGNFRFPKMDVLEHLFVKMYNGSFPFLLNFKSLKTLSLSEGDIRDCLQQMRLDIDQLGAKCSENALSTTLQVFQVFSEEQSNSQQSSDRGVTFSTEDISVLSIAFPSVFCIRAKGTHRDRSEWFRHFPKLQILEENASDTGIGGLKGAKSESNESCYCYCCGCGHKLQRLAWSFR